MRTKISLLTVGLCLAAAPALAGDLTPQNASGPMMLSDTQMDSVVGGQVIARYLVTGKVIGTDTNGNPIYKTIDKPTQGGKMYAGEGPNNEGVTSVQDVDVGVTLPVPLPPGLLTVDATLVGKGHGARFVTVNLNLP
ncbi:hypothetical protein [Emcibacter sp. SYSU 3D8]|uniref:hypothetical protein n=1 Tax=Emcibacter sp. SYSU 3D8 TaxID=3133969 RepID=UPI0031FE456C